MFDAGCYCIYWSCLELLAHSIAQKLLSTPTLGAGNQDPVVLSWWRSPKRWRSRKDISASLDILDFSLALTWMRQYLKDVCATWWWYHGCLNFHLYWSPNPIFWSWSWTSQPDVRWLKPSKSAEFDGPCSNTWTWIDNYMFERFVLRIQNKQRMNMAIRRSMFKYLDMDWQLHVWKVCSPHSEQTKNEHGNWDTI